MSANNENRAEAERVPMPRDPDCFCHGQDDDPDTFGTHLWSCPQRARTDRCKPSWSDADYVAIDRDVFARMVESWGRKDAPCDPSKGRRLWGTAKAWKADRLARWNAAGKAAGS